MTMVSTLMNSGRLARVDVQSPISLGFPRKIGINLDDKKILFISTKGFDITVDAKQYWGPHWDTAPAYRSKHERCNLRV